MQVICSWRAVHIVAHEFRIAMLGCVLRVLLRIGLVAGAACIVVRHDRRFLSLLGRVTCARDVSCNVWLVLVLVRGWLGFLVILYSTLSQSFRSCIPIY